MKRRVLCLALVLILAVSAFGGCKKKSSNKFYIGAIGPLTEGAAQYGLAVKQGAQIAVDEINEAGGINGYKIEYKFEDDTADGEKAVNAYNTLKDWGMDVLMGTVTTGACLSVKDETNRDNIFQLTPSASAVDVIKYNNCFQVCFTDPNQGTASAKYISDNKLAKKVAVIYDSSEVYSSGIYEKFVAEAKNQGLDIVVAEAFTADSKTDFTVQLTKAKNAGADLVFLPIYYNEAALILKQADAMGYEPTFFGCDGLDGILTVKGFDAKLAEGVMLLTPFSADATDDLTKKFVKKYEEKYNETPSQFAADAYDAIYIIKAALEKADVKPGDDNKKICEAMEKAMTEIKVDGLTGQGMTWTASGEVNKTPVAVVIKDGKYELYK